MAPGKLSCWIRVQGRRVSWRKAISAISAVGAAGHQPADPGFGSAVLWELDGMQPTKPVNFDTDMRSATFSLDGRYLVYYVMGKGLRFYSIQNETLTQDRRELGRLVHGLGSGQYLDPGCGEHGRGQRV